MGQLTPTLIQLYIAVALGMGVAVEGYAPHYRQHLMAEVAARRGIQPAPCMISSDLAPIGSMVWVWGVRTKVLKSCRIVDVSQPIDKARHARTRRIAELSYEVTQSLCGSTRERSIDCPIILFVLEE